MGICTIANCALNCCYKEPEYIGHKIFKKIDTNIEIPDDLSEDNKNALNEYKNLIIKNENKRQEIADKFENMLIKTGACVLRKPTLERGILTYIVSFCVKLKYSAKNKNIEIDPKDINLIKLFNFSLKPPFVSFSDEQFNLLKEKYGFDIDKDDELKKGKESIKEFLESLSIIKEMISLQLNQISTLFKKLTSLEGLKNIKHLKSSLDTFSFFTNVINELTNSIDKLRENLSESGTLRLYLKIADDAIEKKLKNCKEICWEYSKGETCNNINDWKENMNYTEVDFELKY